MILQEVILCLTYNQQYYSHFMEIFNSRPSQFIQAFGIKLITLNIITGLFPVRDIIFRTEAEGSRVKSCSQGGPPQGVLLQEIGSKTREE